MDMIPDRKIIGINGELATAELLKKEGFTIAKMNYRKKYGEIDVIAYKKGLIVFVEVKTRNKHYIDGSLLVPPSKQRKIILVAKEYIARHNVQDTIFRFDIALVTPENGHYAICYIPNAFIGE